MSSTNSKPNQMLFAILKSQGKHNFIDLIKEFYGKSSLVSGSKPFTVLIPTDSAINKISLEPKSKIKYIIKAHILQGNHESFKGQNVKCKTYTGNFDVTFAHHSGGKVVMKDNNGNEISALPVPKNKLPKIKDANFSVYKITSGCLNPKVVKSSGANKPVKKIHGGADDRLNSLRLKIHHDVLNKFRSYLHNPNDCINPYAPAVAGLLKSMDVRGASDSCKRAAILMTNCSFGLFYILVQPFKTRGNHLIPDDVIQEWGGKEYYPADICKFFCDFASKHAPEIYNNQGGLLERVNQIRQSFQFNENYKQWLDNAYSTFQYPGSDVLTHQEKYYFDELKFKLCNVYCNITKTSGDFEDVLLYNMQIIELLFPCNDEVAESKFQDPSYQSLLNRDDLIAPGGIYKFVHSTDFMGLFINQDIVKTFDNIKSDASDIGPNNKNIYNAESYRCKVLAKDLDKIKSVYEYNKKLYA